MQPTEIPLAAVSAAVKAQEMAEKDLNQDEYDCMREALSAGLAAMEYGWVECTARMPGDNRGPVLCVVVYRDNKEHPEVHIGGTVNGAWFGSFGRLLTGTVTHWRPLPDLPSAEKEAPNGR